MSEWDTGDIGKFNQKIESVEDHRHAFGWKLSRWRLKHNLSQTEVAERLMEHKEVKIAYPNGIDRRNVNQWESGTRYPPRIIDTAICKVMGFLPGELTI